VKSVSDVIVLDSKAYINTSDIKLNIKFTVPPMNYPSCLVDYDNSYGFKTTPTLSSNTTSFSKGLDSILNTSLTSSSKKPTIYKKDGVIYALCDGASFKYGTKTLTLPDFRDKFLRETDIIKKGYKRSF